MIDGHHLKRAVGETVDILEAEKEFMNDINVYPVADGDTGTNMYVTLKGVWESILDLEERRVNIVAQHIAEASLVHAKGNSGVILSQFFWGFREGVNGKEALGVRDLAVAFATGTRYAYQAVANPVEGTILTVMRETSEWATRFVRRFKDVGEFLTGIFRKGLEALEKTPDFLAKLGKPRVIDSGAYGFTLFLEGFVRAVGRSVKGRRVRGVKVEREFHKGELYCTNFLVEGADPDALKKVLTELGDSVVVVGAGGLLKVHVHAQDPKTVERKLSELCNVVQRKVERIW